MRIFVVFEWIPQDTALIQPQSIIIVIVTVCYKSTYAT